MKIDRSQARFGITIGDGSRFPAWRGATIEDARAVADEIRDQLRRFILNNAEAGSESGCPSNVSLLNSSRRCQERSGNEFNSFGAKLIFGFRTAKANCGRRNRLIVLTNA